MAEPTAVNDQITDAVTQSNVKVIGEAPAMAMGALYQSLAQSTGILFENAVSASQQANILAQAATTQGVMQIYSAEQRNCMPQPDSIALMPDSDQSGPDVSKAPAPKKGS